LDIEAVQEVFDGLQQINERIIAHVDVLKRLRNLVVTRDMPTRSEEDTYCE